MSENSLENSTFSETNSEAEATISSPSVTESPPSVTSSSNADPQPATPPGPEGQEEQDVVTSSIMSGLRLHDYPLTSLPVHLMDQSRSPINANLRPSYDPELADLLTRRKPVIMTQAPTCATCNKRVYMAEEVRAANKTYHKLCFKCSCCSKLLEIKTLSDRQGELYCKNCYGKNFGPKGYGFGVGAGIMSATHTSPTASREDSPVSGNTDNPNVLKPSYTTLPSEHT
jgi:hypothetical protein